jgi:hypothetical protein
VPARPLYATGLALRDACIAETWRLHAAAFDCHDWTAANKFLGPRIGDLVLELTRSAWAQDQQVRKLGFGYLAGRVGKTWYVQYGPDRDDICAWQNCTFIRVPARALVTAVTDQT